MRHILLVLLLAYPLNVHAAVINGSGTGSSGGAGDVGSVSASTATNPSTETQLKELTLTSGALNSASKKLMVHVSGRYTTAAAQTPTMRFRTYLCTVSGCGSGTVITLQDFTTAATTAATTNSWKLEGTVGTISTGATGTVESKFWLQTQLGAAGELTPETRLDQNNAASASVDLTGVLYVRTTVLMSTANAGNSVTARMAWVDGGAGIGGGSGLTSAELDTCAELAAIMGGETGTCGSLVLSNGATLDAPVITTSILLPNGTAVPGTCSIGMIYFDNDATAGGNLYGCTASNTWTLLGDGGGGSGDVTAASTFGTDNVLIRSDGTSKGVQSTGISVSDTTNDMSGAGSYAAGTTPATAGLFRSPNNTNGPCWRNAANSANLCIKLNASNEYEFDAPINLTGTAGAPLFTGVVSPSAPAGAEQWYFYADSVDNLPKYIYNGESEQTFYTTANLGAASETFTNKTINAESTGNVLTIPKRVWLPAAGCNNATAGSVWNLPTANAPAAACITGTNTQKGVLDFDATTDETAQVEILLPSTWVGAIDANVLWLSGTTTGSVAWCIQLISSADAETDDPAYPAQATGNCVSDAAKGTANQLNVAALTGITATGVAAGELLHIQISRDPNETSTRTDDHAADARLVGVELIYRVTE